MGYLTNRGYLRDLEELREHLPAGWTFNTPCRISYQELEDFREVSHSNKLFQHMLATGRSINRALNGPDWDPCAAELLREQKIAAEMWAEALDDEVTGWYHHNPHESGAYVHTMWARANDREESAQAIFAVDMCRYSPPEFKDQFCDWVRDMARERHARVTGQAKDRTSWQSSSAKTNGLSRGITLRSNGWYWSTHDRKWSRWGGELAGRKSKGKSLADKRRGITGSRGGKRCKTQWR
jgi:hypothetical protein